MKNKINKTIKDNWSWLLAAIISMLSIVFLYFYAGITPVGDNSLANIDALQQYVPFLSEFRYKLLNHENLSYSWNGGLGMDFLMIYTYYLSSPINLLVVFFDRYEIFDFFTLSIFIKIVLATCTMGYYLSRKNGKVENNLFITAFSLCYSFSGYVSGYCWNYMWLDCIALFPLIILGMNRLINEKKPFLFVVSLFLSMFCNFYFSFIICVFLVLWFFTYRYNNVKDFLGKGIRFALFSILAAGMAGVIIVVSFYGLIINSSSMESAPGFVWYKELFDKLSYHFFLTTPILTSQNIGLANVFCGVLTFILFFFFIVNRNISIIDRIKKVCLTLFLMISMEFSYLNYFWHGFHNQRGIPNRLSIIYIFVLIDIAYLTINNIKGISIKRGAIAAFICFFMPILIYFFVDYTGVLSSKSILVIALIMSLGYSFLLVLYINKESKIYKYLFSIFLILEIVISFCVSIKNVTIIDTHEDVSLLTQRGDAIANNENKDTDKGFYREEVQNCIIYNESLLQNIHGTSGFFSSIDFGMIDTLASVGYEVGDPYYFYPSFRDANPLIDDLLGIKYIYSYGNISTENGYVETYHSDSGFCSFENKDALSVGYAADTALVDSCVINDYNSPENLNRFVECSTGLQGPFASDMSGAEVYSEGCNVSFDETESVIVCSDIVPNQNGYIDVYLYKNISESGNYYLEVENDEISNYTAYLNENVILDGDLSWQLVSLGELTQDDVIAMIIHVPTYKGDVYRIPVYLAKYDHEKEVEAVKALAEEQLIVESYNSVSLEGSVEISENKMLFLTIPYTKAWKAYVDGVETDTLQTFGDFIGVKMNPGKHQIKMVYETQGLKLGIAIMIISWVIFGIYVLYYYKKNNDKKEVMDEKSISKSDEEE